MNLSVFFPKSAIWHNRVVLYLVCAGTISATSAEVINFFPCSSSSNFETLATANMNNWIVTYSINSLLSTIFFINASYLFERLRPILFLKEYQTWF